VQIAANGAIRRGELLASAVSRVDAHAGGAIGRLAIGAHTAFVGVWKLANADIAANDKERLIHVGRRGDGARRKVTISAIRFDGAKTILSSTMKMQIDEGESRAEVKKKKKKKKKTKKNSFFFAVSTTKSIRNDLF
jgi:hypothetical protein